MYLTKKTCKCLLFLLYSKGYQTSRVCILIIILLSYLMNKKMLWVFTLGLTSLILAGCGTKAPTQSTDTLALAECLTAKGAVMYGTDRCPHCQNQKKLFGDAFEKINFVNCDPDQDKAICDIAGVRWYPTWKFTDGTVLEGTQTLAALSSAGQCTVTDTQANLQESNEVDMVEEDDVLESNESTDLSIVENSTGADDAAELIIQEVTTTGETN